VDHGADINPIRMLDEFSGNGCCTPLLLAASAVWDAMPGAQDLVILLVSKDRPSSSHSGLRQLPDRRSFRTKTEGQLELMCAAALAFLATTETLWRHNSLAGESGTASIDSCAVRRTHEGNLRTTKSRSQTVNNRSTAFTSKEEVRANSQTARRCSVALQSAWRRRVPGVHEGDFNSHGICGVPPLLRVPFSLREVIRS